MAVNLGQLSTVTSAVGVFSAGALALVTPNTTIGYQPLAPLGSKQPLQKALLFNYEGENAINLQSDITDHFIEDNTSIQDMIAVKPELVTVQGFIGELNDVVPAFLKPLQTIANKLTVIGPYAPQISETAILAYNEAFFLYETAATAVNSVVSAISSINNTSPNSDSVINGTSLVTGNNQNKQQVMFQQFYGYWRQRTLFSVQTPWAVFNNMAIQSLRAVQDPDTRVISSFEVTFKLMRFATTATDAIQTNSNDYGGRASAQSSSVVDLGLSSPRLSPLSFGSQVASV